MRILCYILVIALTVLTGCRPKSLTAGDYAAYIADESNGLRKHVVVGETTVSVSYRPTDLMVKQTLVTNVTAAAINEKRKQYSSYMYFVFGLSAGDRDALHATHGEMYSELLQTLSFRVNDFVTLTTSAGDTIPVGDFMLDRTYGMNASTDVLIVFSGEKARGKDWVQFNVNEFGLGVGNQRFRFDMRTLEGCPAVRF